MANLNLVINEDGCFVKFGKVAPNSHFDITNDVVKAVAMILFEAGERQDVDWNLFNQMATYELPDGRRLSLIVRVDPAKEENADG